MEVTFDDVSNISQRVRPTRGCIRTKPRIESVGRATCLVAVSDPFEIRAQRCWIVARLRINVAPFGGALVKVSVVPATLKFCTGS